MLHDPQRAQSLSLVAGGVLAGVAIAVCAILAFLRPDVGLGGASIVMARESGALYVRVDDTLHPVLNLASARLVTGSPDKPKIVNESTVNKAKHGPLLGIPGAPAAIANSLTAEESAWTVCDDPSTTLIVGEANGIDRRAPQPSVLVTPRAESAATTYLLYDGWRAEVDLRNPAVVRALHLDGVTPRPVSRALLDAIPEAPPIEPPHIIDSGSPGMLGGLRVGTVVRITHTDTTEHYVVLSDGVQRIGEIAADLIRLTDSAGSREIQSVPPDAIGTVPVVDTLPVTTFPKRADARLGTARAPVVCAHWVPAGANTVVWAGDSLPLSTNSKPIELVQADGEGPALDKVFMPPGRNAYVRSTAINGIGGSAGPFYLVADGGILFGIQDEDTGRLLCVSSGAVPAPWPVLSLLPRGPELSKASALVARDSILPP